MTRIVKKPDIRKSEIINSAQRLFYQKGFENTTVNEIILTAGIAKGTFYHYFKAKDDLIAEIIDKYVSQIADDVEIFINNKKLNPIEKLNLFFSKAGFFVPDNKLLTTILVRLIFLEKNRLIKDQMLSGYSTKMTPLLTQLLEEGAAAGKFATGTPLYISQLIISAYLNMLEDLSQTVLDKKLEISEHVWISQKSEAYSFAICKILGVELNSIAILTDELINQYFQIFSSLQQSR